MYYRHYRHNPLFASNPPHTISDIEDQECLTNVSYFDTILKARAFLKQVECLDPSQKATPEMQKKITAACQVISRADKRNTRRRLRRAHALLTRAESMGPTQIAADPDLQKRIAAAQEEIKKSTGLSGEILAKAPRLCNGTVCAPGSKRAAKPAASTPTTTKSKDVGLPGWEEVLGPKGEVVRFKLSYSPDGNVKERRRVQKEQPSENDVVLDITTGLKAWKIEKGRRKDIPVTKYMENLYRGSNLYKVRQLAAGQISLDQFASAIQGAVTAAKRSLKRRKKK